MGDFWTLSSKSQNYFTMTLSGPYTKFFFVIFIFFVNKDYEYLPLSTQKLFVFIPLTPHQKIFFFEIMLIQIIIHFVMVFFNTNPRMKFRFCRVLKVSFFPTFYFLLEHSTILVLPPLL